MDDIEPFVRHEVNMFSCTSFERNSSVWIVIAYWRWDKEAKRQLRKCDHIGAGIQLLHGFAPDSRVGRYVDIHMMPELLARLAEVLLSLSCGKDAQV